MRGDGSSFIVKSQSLFSGLSVVLLVQRGSEFQDIVHHLLDVTKVGEILTIITWTPAEMAEDSRCFTAREVKHRKSRCSAAKCGNCHQEDGF